MQIPQAFPVNRAVRPAIRFQGTNVPPKPAQPSEQPKKQPSAWWEGDKVSYAIASSAGGVVLAEAAVTALGLNSSPAGLIAAGVVGLLGAVLGYKTGQRSEEQQ